MFVVLPCIVGLTICLCGRVRALKDFQCSDCGSWFQFVKVVKLGQYDVALFKRM